MAPGDFSPVNESIWTRVNLAVAPTLGPSGPKLQPSVNTLGYSTFSDCTCEVFSLKATYPKHFVSEIITYKTVCCDQIIKQILIANMPSVNKYKTNFKCVYGKDFCFGGI